MSGSLSAAEFRQSFVDSAKQVGHGINDIPEPAGIRIFESGGLSGGIEVYRLTAMLVLN